MNKFKLLSVLISSFIGMPTQACDIHLYSVNFGLYIGEAQSARGAVSLDHCTRRVKISLDAGLYADGQFAARAVSNGLGHRLTYHLYQDVGFSQLWGDGTQGTQALLANNGEHPIYAYVPAQRMPPEGVYTDSVMVVVEW